MGQALYRKYRSKTLDEVVGQPHVTETLKKALASGRISHAYLFTGPRGVGKTSVARILAHEVNSLPNTGEPVHLDIIEIDAASNRRIDEVRDLRERVHIAPAAAKYKVYIVDEVHMLTKEAFNALLKTLEEPPAHVIFILATTEVHKLPETIISRTQRFSFKPVGRDDLVEHLQRIAKAEKIAASAQSLELIAEHSDGSVRDAVGLLDQLSAADKKFRDEDVIQLLGIPRAKSLQSLLSAIKSGQGDKVIATVDELQEQGINPAIAAKELSSILRRELVTGAGTDWNTRLLRQLLDVAASGHPQEDLEISLLEAAAANSEPQARGKVVEPKATSAQPSESLSTKVIKNSPLAIEDFDVSLWPKVLDQIKSSGSGFYSALRLARPSYSDGVLTLSFEFSLHQKKANHMPHRQQIASAIEALFGTAVRVECEVDKRHFKGRPSVIAKRARSSESGSSVEAISNIFGAAEVLES